MSDYNNEGEDICLFCSAMPPLRPQVPCMDTARKKQHSRLRIPNISSKATFEAAFEMPYLQSVQIHP